MQRKMILSLGVTQVPSGSRQRPDWGDCVNQFDGVIINHLTTALREYGIQEFLCREGTGGAEEQRTVHTHEPVAAVTVIPG